MKTRRVIPLALAVCSTFLSWSFAATNDAGAAGSFLSWGAGARSLAMGKAFAGVADDASALYWNPAGLTQVYSNQFTAFHASLYEGTLYDFVSYAHPFSRDLVLGVGGVRLYSGDYEYRDVNNNVGAAFTSEESAILFSLARRVREDLSVGVNAKLVNQSLQSYKASGQGLDLAALYHPQPWLNVGLALQNVLAPKLTLSQEAETYPLRAVLGAGVFLLDRRLTLALDASKTESQSVQFATGAEYWALPYVALRGGWNSTEFTAGLGFKLNNFQIDYALGSQALGPSHRFSFTFNFGAYNASVKADPVVFSTLVDNENRTTALKLNAWARYGIQKWTLAVRNGAGTTVRTFTGEKTPPAQVTWDGRDDDGAKVPDGIYQCSLTITDNDGRIHQSSSEKVEILSSVPEMKIDMGINQ